ncbi:MAG: energy transducer TonB [Bacteroidia bacterium]
MEIKKSKRANLERIRVVLFQAGLVVSLLFVITLLSWTFRVEKTIPPPNDSDWIDMIDPNVLEPVLKKPELPKQPEPEKKKIESVFKVVDKTNEPVDSEPEKKPVITITKTEEKHTGEKDPPKFYAQRMPSYKNCSSLTDEDERKDCTEKKLIEELGNKLAHKNINRISGIIYVEFVVNKKGQVSDVKLIKGIDPYLDKEVIKAVQSLNDFVPADNNGVPADIIYKWPVSFKLR